MAVAASLNRSQRNIVVFLPGVFEFLVTQQRERAGDALSRAVRRDHFVDVAALGGDERRQEAILIFLGAPITAIWADGQA